MYKVDVGGGGVCIKWMLGVEGCVSSGCWGWRGVYKVDVGGGGVCIKWMLGVEGCV